MPTQSIDKIATGLNDGIDFNANGQTWTIDPGIIVYSPAAVGISSDFSASTLINAGIVKSGGGDGVTFTGNDEAITNDPGGYIIGGAVGMNIVGDGVGIDNQGAVRGFESGVGFETISDHVVLTNAGDIFGHQEGILAISFNEGGIIHNSGLIRSDQFGIEVSIGAGLVTTITNAAGGIIRGGVDAITVAGGGISLTNHGTIAGPIDCRNAAPSNDFIRNVGVIRGPVDLGAGDDTFNGRGGKSGVVRGGGGNDRLIGGNHGDTLDAGTGKDTLTGGPGSDHFVFDAGLGPTNIDRVTDFAHKADKIDLSHTIFTATNASGRLHAAMFSANAKETAATRILYDPGNGFLSYDQDGSGHVHAPVHFATLAAHLTLSNSDFAIVA